MVSPRGDFKLKTTLHGLAGGGLVVNGWQNSFVKSLKLGKDNCNMSKVVKNKIPPNVSLKTKIIIKTRKKNLRMIGKMFRPQYQN